MREYVINKQIGFIQKYNNFDKDKIEIIKYGLESIYILITKTVIVLTVSYFLGLLKETLIFLLFYNCIRTTAYGLHATKSWICLISSLTIFIVVPYFCKIMIMPVYLKILLGIIGIIFILKNAPADTYKRPIVSAKRRKIFKIISTIIAITMISVSLIISNEFISNSLIFALLVECCFVSPTVYKIFKLPYDNYKRFIK